MPEGLDPMGLGQQALKTIRQSKLYIITKQFRCAVCDPIYQGMIQMLIDYIIEVDGCI